MLRRHSDRFWTVELKLEGAEKEDKKSYRKASSDLLK